MPNPGAPPGAAAVGAPTKVPCSPVSGRIWVAHFVWETDPRTDHPIQNAPPANGLWTREPQSLPRVAVDGRRVYVEAKMVEDPSPRGGDSSRRQHNWSTPLRSAVC